MFIFSIQLKAVIGRHFQMEAGLVEIWKDDVEFDDEKKVMDYNVETDDELAVKYPAV